MPHIFINRKSGVTVEQVEAALPPSVASGSAVGAGQNGLVWNAALKEWQGANVSTVGEDGCINALKYLDIPSGTIDFVALRNAMEEEFKAAYFRTNFTMKAQVLLNMEHVETALKPFFKYRFLSRNGVVGTLPKMANGQFAIRANQNAAGVKEGTSIYPHQDVIFENVSWQGSGENDGGSVFSGYNRTVSVTRSQLSNLNNGYVEEGFTDGSHIDTLTTYGKNVTGWCYKTGEGDGKTIKFVQAYACKGVFATRGTGTATGLTSGIHKFLVAGFTFSEPHLEGDGPNEAGGKPSEALIILNGGDYVFQRSRFFTLTNPARPCIEINDGGVVGRSTNVTFEHVRFMQRLDDPSNPTGKSQPVGNLQGVAVKLANLSTTSTFKFVDTYGEVFQQTSESSQFDTRARSGIKFSVEGTEGLLTTLEARSVTIPSMDCKIRYNGSSAAWEVRPISGDSVTTRHFGQPTLNLTKFASGSAEAKAAPTTRATGKHYYAVFVFDERTRRTNLSPTVSLTLAAGEVPSVEIVAGQPCRAILLHGTVEGVWTDSVTVIVPNGSVTLSDMGSAIGGQEWKAEVPALPTTEAVENTTVDGIVHLGSSAHAMSYFTAIPTKGEWQREGDTGFVNGVPARCLTNAAGNNGGTWILLPSTSPIALSEGESTITRGETTTTAVTMTTKVLRLGFFLALKTEKIKHFRADCATAYSGGVPSVVRFGAWLVNPTTGKLEMVGQSANNTALLEKSGVPVEPEAEAAWEKVAGQRYALGLLVVTAGTAPTIGGQLGSLNSEEQARTPRLCAAQTATEALPSTIENAALQNSSAVPYLVVAP
jgi:hypothetical protein